MIEPHRTRSPSPRLPPGPSIAAFGMLFLFWGLCAVASFLPGARLWGINHLAFYSWPIRVAGLAVMALSMLPQSRRAVLRGLSVVSMHLAGRRWLVAAALSIACFALFNAFASSTHLLGDGLYVENNIERAPKIESDAFTKVLKNPDPIYPATEMLYLTVTRMTANRFGVEPLAVLRVLIGVIGALLVFIVAASRPAARSGPAKEPNPLVVLAFLSGAVQIFFGYVEVYAPIVFFAPIFVLSAGRTLHRGEGLWRPAVCVFAAVGMHVLGLVLLPALGVIVLWVVCGRERTRRFIQETSVLAAVTIVVPPLVVLVGRLGRFVLPVVGRDGSYAVLSTAHLLDVANEMLLVFPGFFVLATVAIVLGWSRVGSWWKVGDPGSADRPSEGQTEAAFPTLFFSVFLALPALLFLLFFKPELGMARDWDLFAIPALGFGAPVYAILWRARSDTTTRGIVDKVLPPVLVMSAVLTSAWVGVNAHAGRSVARFESILSYDCTNAGYAYETLASHHHNNKDIAAEIEALEKAVEASRNPRYLFTLGLRYYHVGEKDRAVSALETCLQVKPDHDEARRMLGQMLFFMERYDDLLDLCDEGARRVPDDPYYPFFMGVAYSRKGRASAARDAFEKSLRLDPPPELMGEIDRILRTLPSDTGASRSDR